MKNISCSLIYECGINTMSINNMYTYVAECGINTMSINNMYTYVAECGINTMSIKNMYTYVAECGINTMSINNMYTYVAECSGYKSMTNRERQRSGSEIKQGLRKTVCCVPPREESWLSTTIGK